MKKPVPINPFSVLIDTLSPLSFELSRDTETPRHGGLMAAYLAFYQMDFADQFEGVEHRIGTFQSNGFQLVSQYWVPQNPRGTVFVVHGYFDHCGLYGKLVRHLLAQNYAVVCFDLPGHGLSSGERVTIETFDHYVDVFKTLLQRCEGKLPEPWNAVGQSTGAAILIKYVGEGTGQHPNRFAKVSLLAPLVHPRAWKKSLRTYKLIHRIVKKIKRVFVANTSDDVVNRFIAEEDPLQSRVIPVEWIGAMKCWTEEFAELPNCDFPIRVVQGDCDNTVDWQYNIPALQQKFSNIELKMIEGAQHHLVNEIEVLRQRVFAEIDL